MLTRLPAPKVFDSSKAVEGEAIVVPAAVVAAEPPATTVVELDAESDLGMPSQGGQPCNK